MVAPAATATRDGPTSPPAPTRPAPLLRSRATDRLQRSEQPGALEPAHGRQLGGLDDSAGPSAAVGGHREHALLAPDTVGLGPRTAARVGSPILGAMAAIDGELHTEHSTDGL